jgi:hypothetical protein
MYIVKKLKQKVNIHHNTLYYYIHILQNMEREPINTHTIIEMNVGAVTENPQNPIEIEHVESRESVDENDMKRRFGKQVFENDILPEIRREILEASCVQKMWNIFAGIAITLKYLIHAAATIFAFLAISSKFYNSQDALIIVGILNVSSTVCEQLGKYCVSNSEKRLQAKNDLINSLGINYKIPNINFHDPEIESSRQLRLQKSNQ